MDIEKKIKESRDIKDNSLKIYMISLRKLNGNKPVENLEFLADPEKIFDSISDLALTTKKNRLTAILVALGAFDKDSDLINTYKEKLDKLNEEYFKEIRKNIKTEKQSENWATMKQLIKVRRNYLRELEERGIKNKKVLKNRDFSILQNYLISSLYTMLPPIRLDYSPMTIITSKDEMEEGKNYLLNKSRNNKEFIIQDFKNVKSLGAQTIQIPKELNSVINFYLKYKPDDNNFLYNNRGGALTANGLGKMIVKVFSPTGKNINLGLLRKIYISENVNLKEIKKAQKLAADMLHSPQVQQEIYYKKDD